MDIFSHGLWSGAIYKSIKTKTKKSLNIKAAVIWGVLPDIFSFTPLFIWLFGNMVFGNLTFSNWPHPDKTEPVAQNALPIFKLTSYLYSFSHSLFSFILIFGLFYLIFRKFNWEMGAWLMHILIDIPTHSYKFYPTPFLWPISKIEFNGFSWTTPWFLIANYSAIILTYSLIYLKNKNNGKNLS